METPTQHPSINSVPQPTFHLFPNLPTELRLQIWALTFTSPQEINLTINFSTQPSTSTLISTTKPSLQTSTPPSPILQVNQESRDEALRTYISIFKHSQEKQKSKLYINPNLDTLLVTILGPSKEWTQNLDSCLRIQSLTTLTQTQIPTSAQAQLNNMEVAIANPRRTSSRVPHSQVMIVRPRVGGDEVGDYLERMGLQKNIRVVGFRGLGDWDSFWEGLDL